MALSARLMPQSQQETSLPTVLCGDGAMRVVAQRCDSRCLTCELLW